MYSVWWRWWRRRWWWWKNRANHTEKVNSTGGVSSRLVTLQKQWTTIRRYSMKAAHTEQTHFSALHLVHLRFHTKDEHSTHKGIVASKLGLVALDLYLWTTLSPSLSSYTWLLFCHLLQFPLLHRFGCQKCITLHYTMRESCAISWGRKRDSSFSNVGALWMWCQY